MRGHRTGAVLLAGGLLLTGCGGTGDNSDGGEAAAQLLTRAKTTLDDASSVHFELTSKDAPPNGSAVLGGTGDIARPAGFAGTLQVQSMAGTVDVQVVSVDGTVYAQLPFTSSFTVVNPAALGFGDPGALIDPDTGISQLLTAAESPKLGEESRVDGEVVRTVTASLPGDLVESLLTTADPTAPVDAVLSIAEDSGELRQVQMTGQFFAPGQQSGYTIVLSDYGADVQITAPPAG